MTTDARGKDFVIEKWAATMIFRFLAGVILLAAIVYVADWGFWRARVAGGGGMDQVQVNVFVVGELKGGKEDYYPQGTSFMPCSKTLYPQGGNSACWWLQRHREQIQRY
jgi:hypothetical protein